MSLAVMETATAAAAVHFWSDVGRKLRQIRQMVLAAVVQLLDRQWLQVPICHLRQIAAEAVKWQAQALPATVAAVRAVALHLVYKKNWRLCSWQLTRVAALALQVWAAQPQN